MSEPLPEGIEAAIEFQRADKAVQRGVLPVAVDYSAAGFEFVELSVPANLGFREPFRVEQTPKWIALATVAEIRYLPAGTLSAEFGRLRELHEQVQRRMDG